LAVHGVTRGSLSPTEIANLQGRLAFTYAIDPDFVDQLLARHGFESIAKIGNSQAD
jgi:hypothetical protein